MPDNLIYPLRIHNAGNQCQSSPCHVDQLAYLVYSPAYGQSRKISVSPMSA
jgi:hypothetical protein